MEMLNKYRSCFGVLFLSGLMVSSGSAIADAQGAALSKGANSGRMVDHGDGTYTLTIGGVPEHFSSKEAAAEGKKAAEAQGKSVTFTYDDSRAR
jgi:hypothetical protein